MRFGWIVLCLFLSACGNYQQKSGDLNDVNRAQRFKTLSFDAMKTLIFQPKCYQCHSDAHGNKGNVNLERLADVQKAIHDIVGDVRSDKMPKDDDPVSPQLKQALILWAQDGAKEKTNIPMPRPGPPAPPPPPGFDQINAKIFQPYCVRCHSILSDPQKVAQSIDKIQGAIASGKMPKDSEKPLSPKLQKLLSDWVTAGMPMGFEEVKQKVLVPYCIRCHGNFKRYESVIGDITDIWADVMDDTMPLNDDPIPADAKKVLDNWVKQGMPN